MSASSPAPAAKSSWPRLAGTGTGPVANSQNTVSEDGSRVFFTAERQTSPNPAEIGKQGIFVREDGTTSRDLSLSETSTPAKDATYQWATPDGSKVFFTANAGLTDESSSEGTDLYVYDLESEELTDLTPYQRSGRRPGGRLHRRLRRRLARLLRLPQPARAGKGQHPGREPER